MTYDPARPDGTNDTLDEPISPDGAPVHGRDYTIPPRQGRAVRLRRGERLRVTNPEGTQVCDFFALVEGAPAEYLSMEHCHTALGRMGVRPGDALVTNRRRAVLRLVEDTSPGVHDTLIAACDHTRYQELGCSDYHDNCADNFRMALMAIGLKAHAVPAPLNLWMNVPLDAEGRFDWTPPVSRPGDSVTFEALEDVVAVMSACPQDLSAVNGAGARIERLVFSVEGAR